MEHSFPIEADDFENHLSGLAPVALGRYSNEDAAYQAAAAGELDLHFAGSRDETRGAFGVVTTFIAFPLLAAPMTSSIYPTGRI